MKELYIIRGLPGSGKSTFAQKIADAWYEADQYFLDRHGAYQFDRTKLKEAHEWCQTQVNHAMSVGFGSIAVSNTFTRRWEIAPYVDLAFKYDYTVTEVTMTGPLRRNEHDVSDEIVEQMRARWEK